MTITAPESSRTHRPQSWRIELPVGSLLINANDSLHFRKKAELVKALRTTAWATARQAKLPALQRAHVHYVIHPDTKGRRRDPGNWSPSAKAAVDGLVDAGVLPDDNHKHLLGPDPRLGHPIKGSQLVLWITDLDQMTPDHIALLNPPGDPS
ncbi:hypothetical protein OH809_45360 (plasmid) [Streptomyces sp. NBC_00873]|uniref:hypothetical protein n=1 Tax=Streptomyces sp. NBC_00873 TaxID=2975852 RepID=UPI0037DC1880|nr:hypothetical protein OH809_45360 [Streptomyces sp. NBC_00873]